MVCTAVHNFVPEDAGDLAFEKGDLVVRTAVVEGGWWQGRNAKGEVGVFPSNYVVEVDPVKV